jgi:hypothetical protein
MAGLPFSAQRAKALPASTVSGIFDPIIIGPGVNAPAANPAQTIRDAPAPVRAALLGPLGLLIGADLDLVDVALRIGAGVIGVALLIAGGFLIVKEQQAGLIGNVVKGVIK